MDAVYGLYNNNASAKIHLKEYLDEYAATLRTYRARQAGDSNSLPDIMRVDLGNEEMEVLAEYCSIEQLSVDGEFPKIKNSKQSRRKTLFKQRKIPDDTDLRTLKELKNLFDTDKLITYKYKSEIFINYEKAEGASIEALSHDGVKRFAVPHEDILVRVRVYEPFTSYRHCSNDKSDVPRMDVKSVITVLGSQTLAQLRDKITCISDLSISVESSNAVENAVGAMAKDVYKSGFFFIEDTFYNDYRDPLNTDTSRAIAKWAESHQLGPFRTASMERVRIDSLRARFGFPWVYQHQGSCEHLIILSFARFVSPQDELDAAEYPRIDRIKSRDLKYCMMCAELPASWIVIDSDRVPHNPCRFCDRCFKSYNYIDGVKVGNFKAYKYPCYPSYLNDVISVDSNKH